MKVLIPFDMETKTMPAAYKDQSKKKVSGVMVRFTPRERQRLDREIRATGATDAANYIRETVLARLNGVIPTPPINTPHPILQQSEVIGVWQAFGPSYDEYSKK